MGPVKKRGNSIKLINGLSDQNNEKTQITIKLRIGRLSGEGVSLIRSLPNALNAQKVKPAIAKISKTSSFAGLKFLIR